MSLSLIALVAFSACTDDTDGGRGTGAGGNGLSFLVSTGDTDARTRADGSRADASTRYLDPVELNGKMGGKSRVPRWRPTPDTWHADRQNQHGHRDAVLRCVGLQ